MRYIFVFFALFLSAVACSKAPEPSPEEERAAARAWFEEARFGMFIHWGVYSVLGQGEWVMHQQEMTVDEYEALPAQFDPVAFDPDAWVRLAKEAGMKYITITSKHHDGFAMWDSDVSDYDIVDRTPYGRDVLKMLADACERHGLKLFFYHSHLDWRHPDYFPRGRTGQHSARPDSGDFDRYLDYMNEQIAELAGGDYGTLGGFWFDGWWDQQLDRDTVATQVDWRLQETYDLIHRLQPQALIGNNHHVAPFPGEDFQMFERDLPGSNTAGFNTTHIGTLPLETCETMNGSWGYHAEDDAWKSTRELVHLLVRSAGHDANLLLNVGPRPDGTFEPEVTTRLREVGAWTSRYGDTVFGTRGGPMPPQSWGVSTQRGDAVFVHVLDAAAPGALVLPGTGGLQVRRAYRFDTEEEVPVRADGDLVLDLPTDGRDATDTVVVLELDA